MEAAAGKTVTSPLPPEQHQPTKLEVPLEGTSYPNEPGWATVISPWIAWSFPDLFASRRYPRMAAKQQAAYMALLGEQAINGPLPTDLDELAFLACRHTDDLSASEFPDLWTPLLSGCFEEIDGRLVNRRMAMESEVARQRSEKGRNAARKRWDAEKQCSSNAQAVPEQCKPNAMTGQDKTGQTGRTPGPSPDLSLTTEMASFVAESWPGSGLARGGADRRAQWQSEWDSTGYTLSVGRLATERYRTYAAKPEFAPSVGDLEAHVAEIVRDAEARAMTLDNAMAIAETEEAMAERVRAIGVEPGSRIKDWPLGAAQLWKRAEALRLIEVDA